MRHRRMGSHELNMESSRSHSIMTVYCDAAARAGAADDLAPDYASLASSGKISFVDLVGRSACLQGCCSIPQCIVLVPYPSLPGVA